MKFRIGWFSTGRDKQARTLLEKTWAEIKKGKLRNIEICYVFSNRETGEGKESDKFIKLVQNLGIPIICFSSQKFYPDLRKKGLMEVKKGNSNLINKWRDLYDDEIIKRISKYQARIIFLAGYMLILGAKFCKNFMVLNLHPALPEGPKGTWQEVIWQLIEKKKDTTGIMIHRVTENLDAGPALAYCTFPIKGPEFDHLWDEIEQKLRYKSLSLIKKEEGENQPLFSAIREEQKKREFPLILSTLKLISEGKIDPLNLEKPTLIKELEIK